MKAPILSCVIVIMLSLGVISTVYADSATWNFHPANGDWDTAANWTPNTVPNGPDDIATFGLSGRTSVLVSTDIEVNEVIFSAGASPFTIHAAVDQELTVSGIGISNNSGIAQNFIFPNFAGIALTNDATVGDMIFFTLRGGQLNSNSGGFASFSDNASAGNGTFVLEPPLLYGFGGLVGFNGNSNAGNGTFTLQFGSRMDFYGTSSAANGTFIVEGGLVELGLIDTDTPTAGNGVFIINSGSVTFYNSSSAGNATLIANPGVNGAEGGRIFFENRAHDGGEARMELFGNGTLDIQFNFENVVTVGSIEGDGFIELGTTNQLVTGANNLSTIFSGVIEEPGSLAKIGTGTLTLSGANTYASGTTISSGILLVSNGSGSGTGTGAVNVDAGTLGGSGTIAGAVTVGTGSGVGAFLETSAGVAKPSSLSIQSTLTFMTDSTYTYNLNTNRAKADKVIADGVTIDSGAQFNFVAAGNKPLNPGKKFIAISNTAATPISGTFANLPDGATFTVGPNAYQASYEGGDGNDLTLTVVP